MELMKMKKLIAATIGTMAIAAFAAPVLAGPVGIQRLNAYQQGALVNALQNRTDQLAQQADLENARGPLRIAYMDKQDRINDILNQLESGQPVAVSTINEAFEPVTD
jgi:hypothetical protein